MLGSKRVQCVFCEFWHVSWVRCHKAVRADMDVLTPLVLDLQTTVQGWERAGWRSQ